MGDWGGGGGELQFIAGHLRSIPSLGRVQVQGGYKSRARLEEKLGQTCHVPALCDPPCNIGLKMAVASASACPTAPRYVRPWCMSAVWLRPLPQWQSQPLGSLSACSGIKSSAAEVPLDEPPVATVVDTGKVKGRSQTTHVASTVADVLTQNNCLDAEKKPRVKLSRFKQIQLGFTQIKR